jgi:hypothetical protein
MHQEMPSITASAYSSSAIDNRQFLGGVQALGLDRRIRAQAEPFDQAFARLVPNPLAQVNQPKQEPAMSAARIVKVFIADSNDNLPLEKRVLYSGDERLTDLTDQELFFDVPIADLLAKHNEVRKATIDKTQAEKFGRDIFLEPARIRDLKMVVVTVAQF